jgi:hypothetical protein
MPEHNKESKMRRVKNQRRTAVEANLASTKAELRQMREVYYAERALSPEAAEAKAARKAKGFAAYEAKKMAKKARRRNAAALEANH